MKKNSQKPVSAILLLILPTAIIILSAAILMNWAIPTRVEVNVTLNRVFFEIGGSESITILNTTIFRSLTVEKFNRITFHPKVFAVADPAKYSLAEDGYPESAWNNLKVSSALHISGDDGYLHPAVTLEKRSSISKDTGLLDHVRIKPGTRVTLEIRGTRTPVLALKIEGQSSSAVLSMQEPFLLLTAYSQIDGLSGSPFEADLLTYQAQLPEHSTEIEIDGEADALILILTISPKHDVTLFAKEVIPVTAMEFIHQKETGDYRTALVKEGSIIYPKYPQLKEKTVRPPDFLSLENLEKFQIKEIGFDPHKQGIFLRMEGIAGSIRSGTQDFIRDYRLTLFDTLWLNPRLMIIFSILVWIFPTTVGGYKLFKELRK
jgi:hypothetical protein